MKEPVSHLTSRQVFVTGFNTLQNGLLASTLQRETGFPCTVVEDLAQISPSLKEDEKSACLALCDCLGKDARTCLADLGDNGGRDDLMLGLFNLEKGAGVEKEALFYGVRGFFYRGEPVSLFVKGIVRIFEGELWIPRLLLSKLAVRDGVLSGRISPQFLSGREKEILGFLADGATNKEIADALFISPYTVKNHLQKIYRKIDVHTKTQAARWGARHLGT